MSFAELTARNTYPRLRPSRCRAGSDDRLFRHRANSERHAHDARHGGQRRQLTRLDLGDSKPAEIMSFVVDDHLAAPPFGEHGDKGVMGAHAAFAVALKDIESGQCFNGFDDEAGLFPELARDRCEDGLAEFLDAAWEAPFPDARRPGALHQEHPPLAAHDAEDADD